MNPFVLVIHYSISIAVTIVLLLTFIYAGFNNFRVTITMNSIGEFYIEVCVIILWLISTLYCLVNSFFFQRYIKFVLHIDRPKVTPKKQEW